ncbi:MAG: hypothetical protein KBS42_05175 [Bacteroidales bacterium]|nr:hypothetical protein [Candidatus Colicola coprequi]
MPEQLKSVDPKAVSLKVENYEEYLLRFGNNLYRGLPHDILMKLESRMKEVAGTGYFPGTIDVEYASPDRQALFQFLRFETGPAEDVFACYELIKL